LETKGTLARAFEVEPSVHDPISFALEGDLVKLSGEFNAQKGLSPFLNTGLCLDGRVHTLKTSPHFDGRETLLSDILENGTAKEDLYIKEEELPKWEYLKGAKKEIRKSRTTGYEYHYSEGGLPFPDALDRPSRTIITGEGGRSPSRFKHVVTTPKGLRRLSPLELERLNMFPENHTQLEGITDAKRAFFMGNALVVGIVEQVGNALYEKISPMEE